MGEIISHGLLIDGGGGAIKPGGMWDFSIPYKCQIKSVVLLSDLDGDVEIDLWVSPLDKYPPGPDDTICDIAWPRLKGNKVYEDTELVGWLKVINAGDTIRYYVRKASVSKKLTITLKVEKL